MIDLTMSCDPAGAYALNDRFEKDAADVNGPMGDALFEAGRVYLEAMRMRYGGAAAGDGTWAPLAPSTIAQKAQNADLILVEYGNLYTSLLPGSPENILRSFVEGTVIGVESGTANRVAGYHHFGAGRLPRRRILVEPDTLARMHMDAAVSAGMQNLITALRAVA